MSLIRIDNDFWKQRPEGEEIYPKLAKPFSVDLYLESLVELGRSTADQIPLIKDACSILTQQFQQGGIFINTPNQVIDLSTFRGPIQELIDKKRPPTHAHVPELQEFSYGELRSLLIDGKRKDLVESLDTTLNGNGMSSQAKVYVFNGDLAGGSRLDGTKSELSLIPPTSARKSFDSFISTAGRILEAKFSGRRINRPTGVSFKSLAQLSFVGAMPSSPLIARGNAPRKK